MFTEYETFDAVGLQELINRGDVSAVEVTRAAIHLAEARNPAINAIVTPLYDEATKTAPKAQGPLAGIPFLIKDLAYVEGVRCSYGSRLWKDFVPDHDAEIVKRYRNAGLVIMGKSNTPEVGLAATTESVFLGPCKNPWDLTRTTGGSSGGAAAAVAAGILPVAHATDGGGSIRIPASCCGLVGLKPSRARTPLGPDVGEGWGSMATGHVVSRTVRDTAALLDVTHGPAAGDPYYAPRFEGSYLAAAKTAPARLKIAIDMTPINSAAVHPECRQAVEATAALCESLGHHVDVAALDYSRDEVGEAAGILVAVNVRHNVMARARELNLDLSRETIEAHTLRFVDLGAQIAADQYVKSLHTIHHASRQVATFLDAYDLILSPTLLCPPPRLGFMDTSSDDAETYAAHFNTFWGFTNLYNATGNPAISLPLHWTKDGLPVGVQFAGRVGEEDVLLSLAGELEAAAPWRDRRAPIAAEPVAKKKGQATSTS